MIRGVGCDLTDLDRIAWLLERPRFLQKVFTPYEQAVISAKGVPTAAGLWAAKEAVSKALGTGFVGFTPLDVEIIHTGEGQPQVRLHNGAQVRLEQFGGQTVHLSITHERDKAMAFAVAE